MFLSRRSHLTPQHAQREIVTTATAEFTPTVCVCARAHLVFAAGALSLLQLPLVELLYAADLLLLSLDLLLLPLDLLLALNLLQVRHPPIIRPLPHLAFQLVQLGLTGQIYVLVEGRGAPEARRTSGDHSRTAAFCTILTEVWYQVHV